MEQGIKLYKQIKDIFSTLKQEELLVSLERLEISSDRKKLLSHILAGSISMDVYTEIDIRLYVIKNVSKKKYESLNAKLHLLSSCDLYEYDPAKNGQNLIKHGISFSEVVSYSSRFGALTVQCPDKNDNERVVIFSDLSNLRNGYNLELPLKDIDYSERYVISIAQNRGMKFRFISSRVMSRNKYSKTLKSALKKTKPRP